MTYPVSAQLELPFAPASLNPVVNFSVTLADTPVEYVLHRSGGRRRISISVDERGLRVGAPLRASLREIEGVLYCNDGDWVESRTALVEHMDGRLEMIHWKPDLETQNQTALIQTA